MGRRAARTIPWSSPVFRPEITICGSSRSRIRRYPHIAYTVDVIRDVPVFGIYGVAFLVLLVPPALITWRAYTFEHSRWAESDHPPVQISGLSSSSEDDS